MLRKTMIMLLCVARRSLRLGVVVKIMNAEVQSSQRNRRVFREKAPLCVTSVNEVAR